MNAIIIFDSVFGNTEKIAQAIAKGLGAECACLRAGAVSLAQVTEADLVIMGSPTRSFAATPAVMSLLDAIPPDALAGKKIAAFDTRILMSGLKSLLFKKIIDRGGYAAPIIAEHLESKGGSIVRPAEGFFVKGEEGPLAAGELERAEEWGKQLI
jgi:flavodoxin